MKMKKSKIELAREIIANLRSGMNRQPAVNNEKPATEATPFMPAPMVRPARRSLSISHSH